MADLIFCNALTIAMDFKFKQKTDDPRLLCSNGEEFHILDRNRPKARSEILRLLFLRRLLYIKTIKIMEFSKEKIADF